MTDTYQERLHVGQRVVVRTAFNSLKRAEIATVPRDWRDISRSETVTSRGAFLKAWVRIEGREPVPWPLEDVFTDLAQAEEACRTNQDNDR